ncbi:MAG: ABC transporter related-protein [uncultured bacterium]|nr:MAG: ABC transporter related-protein [uncultured bacterium]
MSENSIVLELLHIKKEYLSPQNNEKQIILDDVSLKVYAGSSISIKGPSGSGKSTLLNIMGALLKPTSGNVQVNGQGILNMDEEKISKIRNQEIGFLFQMHHLLPQCTVLENILLPTLPFKTKSTKESYERAMNLARIAGLSERVHYKPAMLSGGEKLRAALVRALINEPKILLADEPTGSLDNITAAEIASLLLSLNENQGLTIVMVTHSEELACKMNRRYILKNGQLN